MKSIFTLASIAGMLVPLSALAQEQKSALAPKSISETPAQHDKRMEWFREARFGMFIHWGLYAVPAGEWNGSTGHGEWIMETARIPVSRYEKFAADFNPTQFDAKAWVKMAKDAGMKYLVITTKHHDGFDIYPSQIGDWNIKRTPFGHDPLQELAAACKDAELKLCFYHSIMDWHHQNYTPRRAWNDVAPAKESSPDMDEYVVYLKGQLRELLTHYGDIGILWFDGEWEPSWTHERGVDLYNYVRTLQPDIIVNNRVGKGRDGMAGMDKTLGVGDYGTPEQEIPALGFGPGVDWESCMTMNSHWGYNKDDNNWKSAPTLVRNLIETASKGGNYLLNVGPTAQGTFPDASVVRLREIGDWMKINGEAIYNTTASPFKKLNWGRTTTKRNGKNTTLYLHVYNWPADGQLLVPGLKNKVQAAYVLQGKTKIAATPVANGVLLQLPATAPNAVSSTLVLQIEGAPDVQEILPTPDAQGNLQFPPREATIQGSLIIERKANNKENFGSWLDKNAALAWKFQATKAGHYTLSGSIAGLEDSALDVTVGQQTVRVELPKTGDYAAFETVTLGTFKIPAPGTYTLKIAPVAAQWQPVNLREVALQQDN